MTTFTTLEDLLSVFATLTESVTAARFAEGDALLLACDPATVRALGFPSKSALLRAVGDAASLSKRALEYRMSTSAAFAPDDRTAPVAWDVYRACAATDNPTGWLARAVDGHLSADKVRHEVKATRGTLDEVRVEYVTRTAEATVTVKDMNKLVLRFADEHDVRPVRVGESVQVTITRVVSVHGVAQEAA